MVRVHNKTLMRITAQFVAEQEAGQQPRLDNYIRRYPRYATEIVDFVTYYYALEANLPTVTEVVSPLSAASLAALDRAWEATESLSANTSPTLSALAQTQRCTLAQLATKLDLSLDLIEQLAYCQLDPATLPHELLQRLAHMLAQPISIIRQVLGVLEPRSKGVLAEERAPYALPSRQSFLQAVLADAQLAPAQKEEWQRILEREGLGVHHFFATKPEASSGSTEQGS
jgi:hypothetical protein